MAFVSRRKRRANHAGETDIGIRPAKIPTVPVIMIFYRRPNRHRPKRPERDPAGGSVEVFFRLHDSVVSWK